MILFFKIDHKKKLRLLYCTNFKATEVLNINLAKQKKTTESLIRNLT